jgi:hypothetical protein
MEILAQQGYDFDLVVIGMVMFAVLGFAAVALFGASRTPGLPVAGSPGRR